MDGQSKRHGRADKADRGVDRVKKCHNCKSLEHMTVSCPLPRKKVQSNCRTCGSSEHRGNRCPSKKAPLPKPCATCGKTGHKKKDCQMVKISAVLRTSYKTVLKTSGGSGDNQILVSNDCGIADIKRRFINELLIKNIIKRNEIDLQTCTQTTLIRNPTNRSLMARGDVKENESDNDDESDDESDDEVADNQPSVSQQLIESFNQVTAEISNYTIMVERDRIYIIILGGQPKGYEIDLVTVKNIGNLAMDAFKILDEIIEQKKYY